MCKGLRGHQRLQQHIKQEITTGIHALRKEHDHLLRLYKECIWYHFELSVLQWSSPWHESWGVSTVHLATYYVGPINSAPFCPPAILLVELRQVERDIAQLQTALVDADDYAPGGRAYEQLARETLVGRHV